MASLTGTPLPAIGVSQDQDGDILVLNANVFTVDSQVPSAQAFAVKDGRFLAISTNEEAKAWSGRRTQTIDARPRTVVPGFIDCHNHAPGDMLLHEVIVGNPYEVGQAVHPAHTIQEIAICLSSPWKRKRGDSVSSHSGAHHAVDPKRIGRHR